LAYSYAQNSHIPLFDYLRYFPYPSPTISEHLGAEIIPAFLFQITNKLLNISFQDWVKYAPAFFGALLVFGAFFISKEFFNKYAALFSAFFIATIPGILHRSSAGWYDKEAFSGFIMLFSLYFFARAFKKESWISGIISGVLIGVSATIWGGTQLLFYIYLGTTAILLLINKSTNSLIPSFTPLAILGNLIPMLFNPMRWPVPNSIFLGSLALLLILWAKYFADTLSIIKKEKLWLVAPATMALLLFFGFISPLFSSTIASNFYGVINQLISPRENRGVLFGTVAENSPSSASEIASQLGNAIANFKLSNSPFKPPALFFDLFSAWTLALVASAILLSMFLLNLLAESKRIKFLKEITLKAQNLTSILGIIILMIVVSDLISASGYGIFSVAILIILFLAVLSFTIPNTSGEKFEWHQTLLLIWALMMLYGASKMSRLIFAAALPISILAGFGIYKILSDIRKSSIIQKISRLLNFSANNIFLAILLPVLFLIIFINHNAALAMAESIGPNKTDSYWNAWLEALNWARENTPPDSVLYSWWDYGYWFQSVASRASIADGGNTAFYSKKGELVNFALADFLTSNNYTEWLPWLKKMGVNYIVLDYTMIGKYSAVTQFKYRTNDKLDILLSVPFNTLTTLEGNQYLVYCYSSRGKNCDPNSFRIYIPVLISNNSDVRFIGPPRIIFANGARAFFDKICTPNGVVTFNVGNATNVIKSCPHPDPLYGIQNLILTSIHRDYTTGTQDTFTDRDVNAALVKLYLRDGNEMPEFEKVFDNRIVKIWKINYPEYLK
jgi:asparagine N-glycosylation enzyme membrane subunit Stt3